MSITFKGSTQECDSENKDTFHNDTFKCIQIKKFPIAVSSVQISYIQGKISSTFKKLKENGATIIQLIAAGIKEKKSSNEKLKQQKHLWNNQTLFWFIIITILAFATRFYNINSPGEIVFDEVHFGKFVSYYVCREYFFDVHPPLGKLVFAGVAKIFEYDGQFNFDKVGTSYLDFHVPYVAMRSVSALCGSLTVLLMYAILVEMKFPIQSCILGACMILFDNALTTQSRLIVLDAQLIFHISVTCYCWVKFRQCTKNPFSGVWWTWLVGTGVGIGAAIGVKFVGLFVMAAIGIVTLLDLFDVSSIKRTSTDFRVFSHWICRFFCLLLVPIFVFIFLYWIHLTVLSKSGPGDHFMTPQFQSTLEGNKIIKSVPVFYGSKVTLKSKVENIYLHSKNFNYPLMYTDGKVSSQGQQVTGFARKNKLNEWIIHAVDDEEMNLKKKRIEVRNGDLIRLEHYLTQKWLLTHDVASVLTLTNQEVTAVDWNGNMNHKYNSETIWRIEAINCNELTSNICSFRLIHNITGCRLFNYQQNLPQWAHEQREINAAKREDSPSHWHFEDAAPYNGWTSEEKLSIESKFSNASKIPFWEKFFELVSFSLEYNSKLLDKDRSNSPIKWPLMTSGMGFWSSKDKISRIYLLGNPFNWYISLVSLPVFIGIFLYDRYAWLRARNFLNVKQQSFLYTKGSFFFLCYIFHYIPFFFMERILYFHHYLPCYVFNSMIFVTVFQIVMEYFTILCRKISVLILCSCMAVTFWKFSVLSYGTKQNKEYFHSIQWKKGWHFTY